MTKSRFFLFFSKKSSNFAGGNDFLLKKTRFRLNHRTMKPTAPIQDVIHSVEEVGVSVEREVHRFSVYDTDLVFPHVILTLCLRGSARSLYDMREVTHSKNELGFILPGHIMRPLECTEDYAYARVAVSAKIMKDLQFLSFSHDYDKFNHFPICALTDEQAEQLLAVVDLLAVISGYTEKELPHRHYTLMAQLAVGFEFLNHFRVELDRQWAGNKQNALFNRFCDLVVEQYKEHKDTTFYAEQLNLSPKYFSKLIRSASNGLYPSEWIERYVTAQAKRLIMRLPQKSLQEIGIMLGFNEPTCFYRYFKRVTGMTAKEYRNSIKNE